MFAGGIFTGIPANAKYDEIVSACAAASVRWMFGAQPLFQTAKAAAKAAGISATQAVLFDPPGLPAASPDGDVSDLSFNRL